jgi:hypothetical protein
LNCDLDITLELWLWLRIGVVVVVRQGLLLWSRLRVVVVVEARVMVEPGCGHEAGVRLECFFSVFISIKSR